MMGIFFLITLPILAGFLLLLSKSEGVKKNLALAVFLVAFLNSIAVFIRPPADLTVHLIADYNLVLSLNGFSKLMLVFISFFGLLTCLYSRDYLKETQAYYSYILWLLAFSNLAVFSADFILFIFSWGATLVLLYALLNLGSGYSAKKALSILGAADFSLLLGICLYIAGTGSTSMAIGSRVVLNNPLVWFSFVLMFCGSLAKAGCGPFHTWIPTAAESAPIPVMAILPASLDKLLGIYLLARMCSDFFLINNLAQAILLITGALTIMFAVMMALMQHDLRKLLSYHAISQVGYMVLGLGTGVPVGVAGGIFHMLNNTIYKTGLFLTSGSVGQKKKTFELEKLGGMAAYMPVTFICAAVFSLSISGVPPLNGFASKWMLYQGALIGLFGSTGLLMRAVYIFALIAAMFGSALTLASFVKFLHAIFLGQDSSSDKKSYTEAPPSMLMPSVILAALCIILGVLPNLFLKKFISPWFTGEIIFIGSWNGLLTFGLISVSLVIGIIIWVSSRNNKNLRIDAAFIGGGDLKYVPTFPATEFYRSIEEVSLVNPIYRFLKLEGLDLYRILTGTLKAFSYIFFILIDRMIDFLTRLVGLSVLGLSWIFRKLHTGNLDQYLAWSLIGLVAMFFILMAR
ncbi:MAG: hypothetical protein FJZ10_03285 [Candidatus Omnitrophica bacterium]|nr:hypothetical protein [Candidatus Omnitrophota bacterium]